MSETMRKRTQIAAVVCLLAAATTPQRSLLRRPLRKISARERPGSHEG